MLQHFSSMNFAMHFVPNGKMYLPKIVKKTNFAFGRMSYGILTKPRKSVATVNELTVPMS